MSFNLNLNRNFESISQHSHRPETIWLLAIRLLIEVAYT